VPTFDIRQFKKSHGVRIFTDKSHPNAVEIEETVPFWIEEFKEIIQVFGLEIKEHLKLIREWQEEAKNHREKRTSGLQLLSLLMLRLIERIKRSME
jgi:hypothetical protein